MKNKHLSFDDRLQIEKGLNENKSFKQIGKDIGKDCTTISKEIKKTFGLGILRALLLIQQTNQDLHPSGLGLTPNV